MSNDHDNSEQTLAHGWDDGDRALAASGGGDFLKIEPNQRVELAFVGEPEVYSKQWPGEDRAQTRAKIQVLIPGVGEQQWDMSKTVFKMVKEERDLRGPDFSRAIFSVKRTGSGTDTRYSISFLRLMDNEAEAAAGEDEIPF
jgi:hypothetical protein